MAIDLGFRRKQVRTLTNKVGCYVLCDLDRVPLYVGQSKDGIRARVNRHLTSGRSDIIANRQVDIWEIAWVWPNQLRHFQRQRRLRRHFSTLSIRSPQW